MQQPNDLDLNSTCCHAKLIRSWEAQRHCWDNEVCGSFEWLVDVLCITAFFSRISFMHGNWGNKQQLIGIIKCICRISKCQNSSSLFYYHMFHGQSIMSVIQGPWRRTWGEKIVLLIPSFWWKTLYSLINSFCLRKSWSNCGLAWLYLVGPCIFIGHKDRSKESSMKNDEPRQVTPTTTNKALRA